jgi:hypothetical protein
MEKVGSGQVIGAKSAVTTSYCVARKLQETKRQFLKMIQAIITWHIDKLTHTCFLYVQITQEIINKMSSPQNKKCRPWKVFEIKPPSNPTIFWAGEALDAQIQGCLNITLAQKWNFVIFQVSAEKSFLAWGPTIHLRRRHFVGGEGSKFC